MDVLSLLWLTARFVLLLAGLIVPGVSLMRALRVPVTGAGAFAGSAAVLYTVVVGLQLLGVTISLGTLAGGLALVVGGSVIAGARFARDPATRPGIDPGAGHENRLPNAGFALVP